MKWTDYEYLKRQATEFRKKVNQDLDNLVAELVRLEGEEPKVPEVQERAVYRRWVTPDWARKQGACEGELSRFEATYPRGLEVSVEGLELAAKHGSAWITWLRGRMPQQQMNQYNQRQYQVEREGYTHTLTNVANCPACKRLWPELVRCLLLAADEMGLPTAPQVVREHR